MTPPATRRPTRAVFFDVDFTLIHPGPTFQGPGYRDFCASVTASRPTRRGSPTPSAAASALLDSSGGIYDPQIFVDYTREIIERMGGSGPGVDQAARDIYEEWAACQHFSLYDDVPGVIRAAPRTRPDHRPDLEHAALPVVVPVALRPRRHVRGRGVVGGTWLHEAASEHLPGGAGAGERRGGRGGDGWRQPRRTTSMAPAGVGMRAVLVSRSGLPASCPEDVPVITTLRDLPALL